VESVTDDTPLIVIVGQTASGKSALALRLAQQFDGEIIAADSRTVYRGMDIGTAKPTAAERAVVPHHLIDVVTPDESFNVADFQRLANEAIADIARRGKLPILVGGTGLYVDAVIYNFGFRPTADPHTRQALEALSVAELQERLAEQGIELPDNDHNPRHLVRALEAGGVVGARSPLRPHTLVLGLQVNSEALEQKITQRVDDMVATGLVDEVRLLANQYGWATPALLAPAYKAFRPYLAGVASLEEAKQQFVRFDLQYAKRQKTWFKRNADIQWISNPDEAVDLVTTLLNK
jgi:tRNA dimethylallyltransferase